MANKQTSVVWEDEDTSWKSYISFAKYLSTFVALMMSLLFAFAGQGALIVGAVTGIFVFLLMLLGKALSDGWNKLYRYLYDLDA